MSDDDIENAPEQNLFLDKIDIQIWSITDEMTYDRVNQAFADFVGANKSEIEGKSIYEVRNKKEAEKCLQGNKKVFQQKKKIVTEEWLKNSRGEKRLLSVTKNPKLNEQGEVEYVVCSAEDITKSKQLEEKLKKSEQHYRTIFESVPVGIIIEDKEGNILEVNQATCEETGFERSELVDNNIIDKLVLPEDKELAKENIRKILQGEDLEFEIKKATESGEDSYVHLKETAIDLPAGEKGILSIRNDVTERVVKDKIIKKLHQVALNFKELTEEEKVLAKTIESAEDVLNLDSFVIYSAKDDKKADKLTPQYYSQNLEGEIKRRIVEDKSLARRTYQERESLYLKDVSHNLNDGISNNSLKSLMSVPIGDYGVFQAFSHQKAAFSQDDLEFVELLFSHTKAALDRISSEKKLKNKNILLDSILESIQDGISVLNKDLTIRYVNSTMEEWYSDNTPLTGEKCYAAYHNAKTPCDFCPSLKSLETGEVEKEIVPGLKDSEVDYLEIYSYPIFSGEKEEIDGVVEFVRDITARRKHKQKLEMTKFSVDKADLFIFRATPEGKFKYANETALTRLGYDKSEFFDSHVEIILPEADYIPRKEFWQKIKDEGSITYEREFITNNGERIPVEVTSQYFQYEGEEYEYVFARDITERKDKEREIKYLLYRDHLTNLYNRRFMEEEINRLDTKRQLPISFIMCDLNGLKLINDSMGHEKGDELLSKTADILKKVVRDEDILARYGGDEFAILLPQTDENAAQKVVERIKKKCRKTQQDNLIVSLGVGTATKNSQEEDIFKVLKKADDKMYQNKLMNSESRKHEVVSGLINALGAKSDETKEHTKRMTALAQHLGNSIGITLNQSNKLSLLATLHDIGKISIPEEILTKPGKPTEKEWEEIMKHPENGYKIAYSSGEFAVVAEEVLSHHERWDGNGYPRGLKGEEIPLLARIISIVDAYDVMINERPYSPAMSREEALQEIKDCAGSQFDPELAARFIKIMS